MSDTFRRTAFLVNNLFYQSDENNCYPFPILISNLISYYTLTKLIECLNKLRICTSPSTYNRYKSTVASQVSNSKDEGNISGFLESEKGAIHMDNIEKYQKHARTPQNALAQGLVI